MSRRRCGISRPAVFTHAGLPGACRDRIGQFKPTVSVDSNPSVMANVESLVDDVVELSTDGETTAE